MQILTLLPLNAAYCSYLALSAADENASARHTNLTTIATFFSAVTATTLQFSFQQTNSALANAVNGFWIVSLVFSISSAINSLLGMTWHKAAM